MEVDCGLLFATCLHLLTLEKTNNLLFLSGTGKSWSCQSTWHPAAIKKQQLLRTHIPGQFWIFQLSILLRNFTELPPTCHNRREFGAPNTTRHLKSQVVSSILTRNRHDSAASKETALNFSWEAVKPLYMTTHNLTANEVQPPEYRLKNNYQKQIITKWE